MPIRQLYYTVKPAIPREWQWALRRTVARRKRRRCSGIWPIDERAGIAPPDWPGWPEGKRFALVLTHDVESERGHEKCSRVCQLESTRGFRSSFNFVPEKYRVAATLRAQLREEGFEVGVHGLVHDGKLYRSRRIFTERAARINRYLREWEACGFRSPSMHHNLAWLHELDIAYDLSTFDVDPFEPQPDGAGTIFPFWVSEAGSGNGYVELPYTLPQDSTLFLLLQEADIEIWKRKLAWIAERGGMALLNTHPDYMQFGEGPGGADAYPGARYAEFLDHARDVYGDSYWHALPREVAAYCKPFVKAAPARHSVCMVAFSSYPGDARIRREAEALREAGAPVQVVCLRHDDQPAEETIRGVAVRRIPLTRKRGGAFRYILEYLYFFVRSCAIVTARHRRLRFSVIHVHNMPDFLVFVALLPKCAGARVALDLHDPMPELYMTIFGIAASHPVVRILKGVERLSIRFADAVITTNLAFRNLFVSRGCPAEKIVMVMNAPQESVFRPEEDEADVTTWTSSRPFHLMYNGTIVERNGLDLAVAAVARLSSSFPDLHLHVYGSGEFLPAVREQVAQLGLDKRVLFHGDVSLERIASAIREHDAGLVPNKRNPFTDLNFPTRIFEFLCLGKPVIAPRTRGVLDYFGKDELFFFEAGSAGDLARAIRELITDETQTRAILSRAIGVYRKYTWQSQQRRLLELNEALGDRRGIVRVPRVAVGSAPPGT